VCSSSKMPLVGQTHSWHPSIFTPPSLTYAIAKNHELDNTSGATGAETETKDPQSY
jgi:hypothetical protein